MIILQIAGLFSVAFVKIHLSSVYRFVAYLILSHYILTACIRYSALVIMLSVYHVFESSIHEMVSSLSVTLFSECMTTMNQMQKFWQDDSRNNGFFTNIEGSFGGIFSTLPNIRLCGLTLV